MGSPKTEVLDSDSFGWFRWSAVVLFGSAGIQGACLGLSLGSVGVVIGLGNIMVLYFVWPWF